MIALAATLLTAFGGGAAAAFILSRKPHQRSLAATAAGHSRRAANRVVLADAPAPTATKQSASVESPAPTETATTSSPNTTTTRGSPGNGPGDVIRQHLEEINAGQYQQAFSLMAAAYRSQNPNWASGRAAADPAVDVISVGSPDVSAGHADVSVDFYARDHNATAGSDTQCREFSGTVDVIQQDGGWRYNPTGNHLKASVRHGDSNCPG